MAAYLYIDESGNFGWPTDPATGNLNLERIGIEDGKADPFMVIAVLAIQDKESKGAISQAVSRAISELRADHKGFRDNPERRLSELKGTILRGHEGVRRRLFKRMVKKADFHAYFIIIRKRDIRQKLPMDYMERYSMLVMNVLAAIPMRRAQRWVTMVVDSQERADPTKPRKVSYRTKGHRLRQKRLRRQDRIRKQKYKDSIASTFRQVLGQRGIHLAVYHTRSEDDRCLQAVDVFANFYYERLVLEERRRDLLASMSVNERRSRQNDRRWQRLQKRFDAWYDTRSLLQGRIMSVNFARVIMKEKVYKIKLRSYRAPERIS